MAAPEELPHYRAAQEAGTARDENPHLPRLARPEGPRKQRSGPGLLPSRGGRHEPLHHPERSWSSNGFTSRASAAGNFVRPVGITAVMSTTGNPRVLGEPRSACRNSSPITGMMRSTITSRGGAPP